MQLRVSSFIRNMSTPSHNAVAAGDSQLDLSDGSHVQWGGFKTGRSMKFVSCGVTSDGGCYTIK